MTTELPTLYCPQCEQDQFAEAPPCPDGHGAQCPDRACVECGTALLFDAPLLVAARVARPGSRIRRADRHAA